MFALKVAVLDLFESLFFAETLSAIKFHIEQQAQHLFVVVVYVFQLHAVAAGDIFIVYQRADKPGDNIYT